LLLIFDGFPVADAYEIEFRRTLNGMANRIAESIRPVDRPPDAASVWCRKFFSELELWWQCTVAVVGWNDVVFVYKGNLYWPGVLPFIAFVISRLLFLVLIS